MNETLSNSTFNLTTSPQNIPYWLVKKYLTYYGEDYTIPEKLLMFIIVCLSSLSFVISVRISLKYH